MLLDNGFNVIFQRLELVSNMWVRRMIDKITLHYDQHAIRTSGALSPSPIRGAGELLRSGLHPRGVLKRIYHVSINASRFS